MALTTITISTEDTVKRTAQKLLKQQGTNLENALNMFLQNIVLFGGDMPVVLHEVADKDIPIDHVDKIAKLDDMSDKDFIIH